MLNEGQRNIMELPATGIVPINVVKWSKGSVWLIDTQYRSRYYHPKETCFKAFQIGEKIHEIAPVPLFAKDTLLIFKEDDLLQIQLIDAIVEIQNRKGEFVDILQLLNPH